MFGGYLQAAGSKSPLDSLGGLNRPYQITPVHLEQFSQCRCKLWLNAHAINSISGFHSG